MMSVRSRFLDFSRPGTIWRLWRPHWPSGLQGSEFSWAIAFFLPYAAVFFAFVVYPVAYGIWLGSDPALYAELFELSALCDNRGQHACC